jgi:hypothetical protein
MKPDLRALGLGGQNRAAEGLNHGASGRPLGQPQAGLIQDDHRALADRGDRWAWATARAATASAKVRRLPAWGAQRPRVIGPVSWDLIAWAWGKAPACVAWRSAVSPSGTAGPKDASAIMPRARPA